MHRGIIIVASALLLLVAAAPSHASDMVLVDDGTVYRFAQGDRGLVVSLNSPNGYRGYTRVPQTYGITASELQLAVDEYSGAAVVVWQEEQAGIRQIMLATYREGTWWGPWVLAGDSGLSAANPQLLIQRTTTMVEEEGSEPYPVSTTIVHLAWWAGIEREDKGWAVYGWIPLEDDGVPALEDFASVELRDRLPFGVNCSQLEEAPALAHPVLFVDPQTGDPHILASDLGNCLIQILQLRAVLASSGDDLTEQRRRHTVIFGRTVEIAINPQLSLGTAHLEVGHGLSVVLYWDRENAIDYTLLREQSWSPTRTLALGEDLDHEQAVTLIRGLAQ